MDRREGLGEFASGTTKGLESLSYDPLGNLARLPRVTPVVQRGAIRRSQKMAGQEVKMERRTFMTGVAALLAALALEGAALAAPAASDGSKLQAIIEACLGCTRAGDACVAHCASMLSTGDTSMAKCNVTVHNMLAVCKAMEDVASYGNAPAANIKALASACAKMCRDCAAACEVHASHHEVCKNCYLSCKKCAAACEASSGRRPWPWCHRRGPGCGR